MARAVSTDPFHCFRFAPKIGFDGKPMSVTLVDVLPGSPWTGPGEVVVEAALKPEIIEFAKITQSDHLVVGVYHITDELPGGNPSLNLVLGNVTPANCKMTIGTLDATSDSILKVKLRMRYDRLTYVFGDCPLAKIVAVI